jgi:gliding motility-associated-like protein
VKTFISFFIFFLVYVSNSSAQWIWARQAFPNSNAASAQPGFSQSSGMDIATDSVGNVYETGWFTDTAHFGSFTVYTPNDSLIGPNSLGSCFLVKYDPNGNVLWAKSATLPHSIYGPNGQFWTSDWAYGVSVAIDKKGAPYVVGYIHDTASFGVYTLSSANYISNVNMFIVKYDANGNVLWAKNSTTPSNGSDGYVFCSKVCIDKFGNAYVTGYFHDTVCFGSYTLLTHEKYYDSFLAKYDPSGNVLWAIASTLVPPTTSSNAAGSSVSIDNAGNVYVVGNFYGTVKFGAFTLSASINAANADVFLVKYDSSGKALWAISPIPASSYSSLSAGSLSINNWGNIYVTGNYTDTVSFGKIMLASSTQNGNSYLVKYDTNGNIKWAHSSKVKSSTSYACGYAVSADSFGNAYITGKLFDTVSFDTNVLIESYPSAAYGDGLFIAKYDSSGNVLCANSLASGGSYKNGISADNYGNVYMGSRFQRGAYSGLFLAVGANSLYNVAGQLAYIAKYTCCNGLPVSIIGPQNTCGGNTILITARGGTSYIWNTGATTNSILVSPTITSSYNVVVSDGNCRDTAKTKIIVNPLPVGSACCNATITAGQTVQLNVSPDIIGSTYNWEPNTGLSCDTCPNPIASPSVTTSYYVTITDSEGCSIIDTVNIDVGCSNLFVPDAFSPNNDGQNDILYVRGDCIKTMDFIIYDRWGNKVFESNSISQGWDGTYKGQPMNTGTYSYYLTVQTFNGNNITKKGNIALIR